MFFAQALYTRRYLVVLLCSGIISLSSCENAINSPLTDVHSHQYDAISPNSDATLPSTNIGQHEIPTTKTGTDLDDCVKKLDAQESGWCEMRVSNKHPSISSVWPENLDKRIRMISGPRAILQAWNSAAFDAKRYLMYFSGGGHGDYGGNEVYEFNLKLGQWSRLNDPSPLDHLFLARDYNRDPSKPTRRLCWMPDVEHGPPSAHTYDGLLFHSVTETLFFYSHAAANGSCFDDVEDQYAGQKFPTRAGNLGWYEFNPSPTETRNNMVPLTWRRVFNRTELMSVGTHRGYPRSAEVGNGKIAFGDRAAIVSYDPTIPDPAALKKLSSQADWGDGNLLYDKTRNSLWSIHKSVLLSFHAETGKLLKKIALGDDIDHGKSLAIDSRGYIVSWSGGSSVFVLNPDMDSPTWRKVEWGEKGPTASPIRRVYGKWIYLAEENVFVGIGMHTTGIWVYRHNPNLEN